MAALLSRFIARFQTIALGALIGLGILMVIDCLVSMWSISRRPVSLHVTKTTVIAPEPFRFTLSAPPGWSDLRLVVRRLRVTERDSEFATLARTDHTVTIESSGAGTTRVGHVRFRAETSAFGLVGARQWTTQATPTLHRIAAPIEEDVEIASVDDQSRLRAYIPGDRIASVSWGATARTGSLHVRSPASDLDEITLVVDVGSTLEYEDGIGANEAVIGRAFHIGRELLQTGRPLRVITNGTPASLFDDERKRAMAKPRNPGVGDLEYAEDGSHHINGAPAWVTTSREVFDEGALIRELAAVQLGPAIAAPLGPHLIVRRENTTVAGR